MGVGWRASGNQDPASGIFEPRAAKPHESQCRGSFPGHQREWSDFKVVECGMKYLLHDP